MSETYTDTQPDKPDDDDSSPPYDDETMLGLVRTEMGSSVGFDNDSELTADRDLALNYYKGEMKDIPSLQNRSKAVSSDVADAVETTLSDILEIFTAGGDVVSFPPTKPEDEDGAQQETDYLNHVIWHDNPGFLNVYTGFKDALLLKTAVFEFGWKQKWSDEDFTGKNVVELQLAAQSGKVVNVKADTPNTEYPNSEPTYSFTVRTDCSQCEFWAIPPEDFAYSQDTIIASNAVYCAARYYPRVQTLIADGYDEKIVKTLDTYVSAKTQATQQARDTAGEHQNNNVDEANDVLRQVEIRKHYLRLIDEDGDEEIWCLTTDSGADKIIPKDGKSAVLVNQVPFAVGSPYLVAHRLCGRSLADLLLEIQKIKTVLMRALLDSSYFAQNQRFEVDMGKANDYTISDLLRNEPMVPVRVKAGGALTPLVGPGLSFDAYKALEYFSTVAEGRTGVVRNAQGLNPDTLHDTAKGAIALMTAAQRRVRMIARVLAETCIKPLYLGMHAVIRENAESARMVKLNGKWLPIDPTTWGERSSMTIEVGLGASGKEMEIAGMQHIMGMQKAAVELQGGANGPLVKLENLYASASEMTRKLGFKAPGKFFGDPSDPKNPPPPPQPRPEVMKIQAEQGLKQQQMQNDVTLEQAKMQGKQQAEAADLEAKKEIEVTKAQAQASVTQHANELEHARKQSEQANELELEKLKQASNERIEIGKAYIQQDTAIKVARINAKVSEGKLEEAEAMAHEDEALGPARKGDIDAILQRIENVGNTVEQVAQTTSQPPPDPNAAPPHPHIIAALQQVAQTLAQSHAATTAMHQQAMAAHAQVHDAVTAERETVLVRDPKTGKAVSSTSRIKPKAK